MVFISKHGFQIVIGGSLQEYWESMVRLEAILGDLAQEWLSSIYERLEITEDWKVCHISGHEKWYCQKGNQMLQNLIGFVEKCNL